jgi:ComF family protein
MYRFVLDPLVSVLYPQRCHVCSGTVESLSDGVACNECWLATRIFDGSQTLCEKCGALLVDMYQMCRECLDAQFDLARAVGVYEGALAATVVRLKKVPDVPKRAANLFRNLLVGIEFAEPPLIIPVPLSKRRAFERGHNQAELLSEIAARATGFQMISTCLARTAHTPMHRMAMDRKAREMTVKSAFEVRSPRLIKGREVLLVDDVLTSGSTVSSCARLLKKNGAKRVTVVTLARAVM